MFKISGKTSALMLSITVPLLLAGCTSPDPAPAPIPTAAIPTITVAPQDSQKVVNKLEEALLYIDTSIASMNELGMSEVGKVGEEGYKTVVAKYNGKLTAVTYYTDQNIYAVYNEDKFANTIIIYTLKNMLKTGFEVTMSSEGIYHAVKTGSSEEYWLYVQNGKIVGVEGTDSKNIPMTVQLVYGLNDVDKALFNAGIENQKVKVGNETGKDTIPQ